MVPNLQRIVIMASLAVMVLGCSSSDPNYLKPADVAAERAAEVKALDWPSGAPAPSLASIIPGYQGKGVVYQVGSGKSDVDQQWFCAWSKEWLDNRSISPSRSQTALAELDGIVKLTIWSFLGEGQSRMSDAIARAKLGDPGPIITWRQYFVCQA